MKIILVFLLLALSSAAPITCPSGYSYYSFTEKCYKVYNDASPYFAASDVCRDDGGSLVSIHNSSENDYIANLVSNNNLDHWIGLTNMISGYDFEWLDNSPVQFTYWAPGQPNYDASCVLMKTGSAYWTSQTCRYFLPFICEFDPAADHSPCSGCPSQTPGTCPPSPTCPAPTTCPPVINCHTCPTVTEKVCSTAPACPACPTPGTCPPPPTCPVTARPTCPACPTIIPATCPPPTKCPACATCPAPTQKTCPTVHPFTCPPPPKCPSCPITTQKVCPTIRPSTCPPPPKCPACPTVRPAPTCPPVPKCPPCPYCPPQKTCPTPAPKPVCDHGWAYYSSTRSCYFIGSGRQVTGAQAQNLCRNQGANLASIHNAAEQSFILNLVNRIPVADFAWIGLYRTGTGKTDFANLDGSPVDYTNWAPKQPDYFGGKEFCTGMCMGKAHETGHTWCTPYADGVWNDIQCNPTHSVYVCKKPAN